MIYDGTDCSKMLIKGISNYPEGKTTILLNSKVNISIVNILI